MLSRGVGGVTAAVALSLLAQQTERPTFRSGIDVVRLDVTVLDSQRRPVRHLGKERFTILVGDEPQPIVSFEEVLVPPPEAPTAAWMRDVAPDVRSNALGEPRLFVILMDDATTPTDPQMVNTGKQIAHGIVNAMNQSDLAAVVFTMDNSHAQDFTSDRTLLNAAIDHFSFGMRGNPLAGRYSQHALVDTVKFLRERDHGRSAVMLISASPSGTPDATLTELEATTAAVNDMQDVGFGARFSPVPIYGFNIAGLVAPNAGAASGRSAVQMRLVETPYSDADAKAANNAFLTLADLSGGRAVINTNDPERLVPTIIDEMSGYYTIAYRATYPIGDRKQRRLKIRVEYPDAIVLPSDRVVTTNRPKRKPQAAAPPLVKAVSDLVPTSDLPMAVTAAPFVFPKPSPNTPSTGVLATVRVRRKAPDAAATDNVQVLAKMFTPEGKEVGGARQNALLKLRPSDRDGEFDVLTGIPLKPGRYNLRISAHSVGLDKTGSVYTDVTVPDFERDRLSMSGIVISAEPATIAEPRSAFARVIPVVPTSDRGFDRSTRAHALVRVCQRASTASRAQVRASITDAAGRETPVKTASIVTGDFTCDLPLPSLAPGGYLLSITASLDATTSVTRDVRFSVR